MRENLARVEFCKVSNASCAACRPQISRLRAERRTDPGKIGPGTQGGIGAAAEPGIVQMPFVPLPFLHAE